MPSPESFLRRQGLEPLGWEEVLRRVEQKLTPPETQAFQRLHRAFAAYPAPHTLRAFYDFAAGHGLLALLASFRFGRLANIAASLDLLPLAGRQVLDVGAGGGYLAEYLRDARGAEVTVTDLSPATLEHLAARGLPLLGDDREARFDFILCADSLGETNADEDDWLSSPENLDAETWPRELEARYGFAEKLAALRPLLAPGGSVLLHEPAPREHFWRGAARALEAAGWRAEILGPDPARGLKLMMNAE